MIDAYSKKVILKEDLKGWANAHLTHKELSGECNNFANLQYPIAPALNVGLRIDIIFNYCDSDEDQDVKIGIQG